MPSEGPGIWREIEKMLKMRHKPSLTWNLARKLKIIENEKHRLEDLKNEEITEKREK